MKTIFLVATCAALALTGSALARPKMEAIYAAPSEPIPYAQMNSYMADRGEAVMNGDAPAMTGAGGAPRHMRHAVAAGSRGDNGPGMNGDAPDMTASPATPHMRHPGVRGTRSANTTPAMNGDAPAMPDAPNPH